MRTARPTSTAVKTAESAPCFNPNPVSSASANPTTAPTTAWAFVLAGPKMLARRFNRHIVIHEGEAALAGFGPSMYSHFARTPGQILYRWNVDQLLERYGADLRLAAAGEDKGRLVHAADDDREALVEQAVQTPNPRDRQAVRHAIALFRSRGADRESKLSATVTLVGLLEERRALIKTELLGQDEGALFQIANQFAIRHRRADQHGDYPDAYLDWMFWCYLATVELTDRIVASQIDSS
jgi:hypothetical protein